MTYEQLDRELTCFFRQKSSKEIILGAIQEQGSEEIISNFVDMWDVVRWYFARERTTNKEK